jgi:hypothetical protein
VTVPFAWNAPVIVAVSETDDPTATVVGDRFDVIVGVTFRTLNGSQELVAALLFWSPL